jgi:hypothetical protein
VRQEIFVPHDESAAVVTWRLVESESGGPGPRVPLVVRPLLSGRDYHSLHHENDAYRREAAIADGVAARER